MFKNLSQNFMKIAIGNKINTKVVKMSNIFISSLKKIYFCNKNEQTVGITNYSDKKRTGQTLSEDEEEDSIVEDKTVYDFFDSSFNLQVESLLNKVKCQGCGIHMQTENPWKIGYIPKQKLKEYLNPSSTSDFEPKLDLNDKEIKEFEKIHDRATLKKLKRLKLKKNVIICERCFKLTNYLSFDDLSKKSETKENEAKVNTYTTLVKKINSDMLISQIMKRISKRAHIFYICVRLNKLGHCRFRVFDR